MTMNYELEQDLKRVKAMSDVGFTLKCICETLNIDLDTLGSYFRIIAEVERKNFEYRNMRERL